MAEISHSVNGGTPGAPGASSSQNTKPPNTAIYNRSLGVLSCPGARWYLSTGYPQLNVGNYGGVWELVGVYLVALQVHQLSLF